MRKCPFCKEDIQDEAIKCKHCGEWLAPQNTIDKQDNLPDVKIVTEVAEKTESLPKEEKPHLLRQNFKLGKMLSGVQIFLMTIFIILSYITDTTDPSHYSIVGVLFFIFIFIFISGLGILYALNRYLLNFEFYNNVQENLKYLGIGTALLFLFILLCFFIKVLFDDFEGGTFFGFLFIITIATLLILQGLSGWRLARFEDDYVGGLSMLGYTMCLSILLPVLFFAIPILTYSIFAKAEEYADRYGFVED